jgi:uncharacterized protein (TIGR03086 family)
MEMIELHDRALRQATAVIAEINPADLARPTPCAGWDLRALLAHCIGQNHGFAVAVAGGDAPASAFAPWPPERGAWEDSAERVHTAFRAAAPDWPVRLVEFGPDARFPVATALGFHLLDTVVHTWDIARSLGEWYEPPDELADRVAEIARSVPDDARRTRPNSAFAPARRHSGSEWATTLAHLGRDPGPLDEPEVT